MAKTVIFFEYRGVNGSLSTHCSQYGVNYDRIYARIRRGWDPIKAFDTPFKEYSKVMNGEKLCQLCKKHLSVDNFRLRCDRKGTYNNICRKCDANRAMDKCDKMRLDIISHYTNGKNCCSICEEDRIEVLDIDHVNCNGWEERKSKIGSQRLLLRIIKDNFPDDYRILCRNCNWIEYLKFKKRGVYRERGHVANIVIH